MNTNTDLAWAAGIVDGEGCIAICRYQNKRGSRKDYLHAILQIGNTDPRMLVKIQSMFGGKIGTSKVTGLRTRPIYSWRAISSKAADVIKQIRPYLVSKADQADVLLAFQEIFERNQGRRGGKHRIPESDIRLRQEMFESIKLLRVPERMEVS
jgi:LAGLIDADG endonuclease